MKRTFALAFAALLTAQLALAGAKAKPEPKKPMPKISPKIELTLDGDAETMLRALKTWFGMVEEEEEKKPEHVEIVVTEAKSVGTVNEAVARLALDLRVESTAKEIKEVPFLPADVSISDIQPADPGAQIVRDKTGYRVRTLNPGTYTFKVEYAARVEKKDKSRTVALPLIPASSSKVELTIPQAPIEVTTTPWVSFDTTPQGENTLLTLYGSAQEKVTVTWSPKVEAKVAKPVVFAEQDARVTVGRGVLRADATVSYSILQGTVRTLALGLPAESTLLSVKGEGIRSWDVTGAGAQRTLAIELIDEVKDSYVLQLQIEQPIADPAAFPVPTVAVQGVERETGSVGILVWKGLKVEPVKTEGVTQVDVREMAAPKSRATDAVHLAYRYLQRPFTIEAKVSEVEAKVSADVLTTVRVSPEALRASSAIDYTIRDAGVFQFRIRMGKGVKLVDLQGQNINNWEVTDDILVIDLRSKAEGTYTLVLETEQAIPQGQTEIDVAAIELLDVARERGHLAFSAYPGIKIDPAATQGITQIDVSDLPKKMEQKPELAFRYLKHPYRLQVALSKVEAEVAAAVFSVLKVDEKRMELTSLLQYDIRKAGIFQLQVTLPEELRLLGCEGENIDDWRVADGTLTVSLKQKTEGKYTLRLNGQQDLTDIATVPLPSLAAIGAEKETGFVAIRADESLRVKTGAIEALAEVDVKEAKTEFPSELQKELAKSTVLLAYKYYAQPWTGTLAAEPIEPYVTADTFTFLSLGEELVQVSATIRYDILYAGVQTFRVKLPDKAANVDFRGEEIKHREEDKTTHTWTISTQAKKKTRFELYVTYEQKMGETIDLNHTGLQVQDVKRETGYLAVAARSDLELVAGEELKALTPIDPQEIPANYKAGITVPLLLAFRYLKHPYVLHATATRHDAAEVLVAVVEACLLSTTLTEDGNLITDVTCSVRNTREQNLAIALPEKADLWHVFVAGRRAIPVRSTDGKIVWTKIPIAGVGDGMNAFTVQLRYGRKIDELGGNGTLSLDFPRLGIPAMRLGWIVSLPDKYQLLAHHGTLRHTRMLDSDLARLAQAAAPVVGPVQQVAQQQASPEFGNVPYNIAAQNNLQQDAGVVRKGRAGGQRSIYTGAKPITANIYTFQSLIAMQDTGTIRSTYMRTSVNTVFIGFLVIVGVGATAAFFVLCGRFSLLWRAGVVFAAVLLLLGVRTLSEDSYREHLTAILWSVALTGIAIVAVVGGKGCIARCRERCRARREAAEAEKKEEAEEEKSEE